MQLEKIMKQFLIQKSSKNIKPIEINISINIQELHIEPTKLFRETEDKPRVSVKI